MTLPTTFRCLAALGLSVGLFVALPGCNPKTPDNKSDKKDKDKAKDTDKKDNTNPTPNPNPTPEIKTPERIDTKAGVGKDAVDFLSAVGAGTAKASQLSSGFVKAIGLPVELPSDKEKGYSANAAESWLRAVGAKLTGMGPMSESSQAGDVAVFSGSFTGGKYWLRMVKEADGWKVDWLSMSSMFVGTVNVGTAGPGPSADGLLHAFAATAIIAAICDKDAMPREQRTAVIAAGMSPTLRKTWAEPFGSDKDHGYDYSPAKLGVKIAELGGGTESLLVSTAADGSMKAEITKAGGAKTTYAVKLVKGTTLGQWLVESITPQ